MTSFHSLRKRDNRIEEDQIQWNARTYLLGIVLLKRCILPLSLQLRDNLAWKQMQEDRLAFLIFPPLAGAPASRFLRVLIGAYYPRVLWLAMQKSTPFFQPIGGKEGVFYQDLHRRLPWVLETFHVQFPVLISLQWPPWPKVKGFYNSRQVLSDENWGYFMSQLIKQLI